MPLHMSLSHHSSVVAVALAAAPVGVDVVDAGQPMAGAGGGAEQHACQPRCSRPLPPGDVVEVFKDVLHPLEAQRLRVQLPPHLILLKPPHPTSIHASAAQAVAPPLLLQQFLMVWALKECAAKIDGRGAPRAAAAPTVFYLLERFRYRDADAAAAGSPAAPGSVGP